MQLKTITPVLLLLALAFAVGPPVAGASSRQLTIMQDDAHVRGPTDATLDEFEALGVDVVKINLLWREVAPGGNRKPSGFDGADPSGYSWGSYDSAVSGIVAHGMEPFLTLGGQAPDWASGSKGRPGTYKPNAKEFGRFAQAAGLHYPQVRIWSMWNEPNLFSWLGPQRRNGIPQSPSIYRKLYLAAHDGLSRAGHGDDTILLGELMPRGGKSRKKVGPLAFLREMACLDRSYRRYRGRAAKLRGCPKNVRRIPTSGLAYHPYTLAAGPSAREAVDDASIGQLRRVRSTIDALARRGKLPRRLKLWITEFGFQTRPPDPFATPIKRAPGLMDLSEWIAFRNRRVASYAQYGLRDDPMWQSGLRFSDGRAKPGVYEAFRMPLLVRSLGGSSVEVFGGLRTAAGARATIESKAPGGSYRTRGSASLNQAGYFRRILRVKNASRHKFRVTIEGRSRVKRPVGP